MKCPSSSVKPEPRFCRMIPVAPPVIPDPNPLKTELMSEAAEQVQNEI